MNKYEEKAERMKNHLSTHPKDYQTVISLFKVESDSVEYELQQKRNLMKREISKHKGGSPNGKQA